MKRLFALSLLALPLVSCSSAPEPLPMSACPQVAIVRDLSVYQHPPAADENNLVISARIGNIQAGCSVDANKRLIDGGFDVVAVRGANTAGRRATIPFFVSVVDSNDAVLKKETYEVPVFFENNERQLKMNVPLNPSTGIPDGYDTSQVRVLVGFQLTPEQLKANTNYFGQIATPTPQQ
jgi:hypothetical protein